MPNFIVTSPDGKKFQITAPEGATQDQVLAYAQSQFQQAPQPAAAPQAPAPTGAADAVQAFGRGASFGFSDRLGALASSLLGSTQSAGEYGDYGGTYSQNLADIQNKASNFHEQHPIADTALNVAGGVMSGAPIAKALSAVPLVAKAYSAMRPWQQYVTTGAAAGGLAGAGNAPEGQMMEGAGTGAVIGAATGAVLPPALRGLASATNTIVGAPVRAAGNALRSPEQQGLRHLSKSLSRDEVTPAMLESNLKQLGPNAMVADAAGKNTLGLADLAATVPGKAKNAGLAALEERAKGVGGRVALALSKEMGVPSTNFDSLVSNLHDNMRAVAKTHQVDKILNTGAADMTGNLPQLMEAPTMKSAIRKAYSIVGDDISLGRADKKTLEYFDVGPDGKISGTVQAPTLRVLDYAKRGLDSIINDGTDSITGKMSSKAERAYALKRELLKNIDTINPEYAAYRSAYADEKAGESALKLGRAFMREDSEVTARRLADMTPAEQKFFQAGAARAVIDQIKNATNTGMAYSKWVKNPLAQEKLQAAFAGNERGFQAFMGQLDNEFKMGQTHAAIGKNSLTAARSAAAKDIGEPIFNASAIPTSKLGLIKSGLDYLMRPSDEVSSQLMDVLMTRDPNKQKAVLDALRGLDSNMSRRVMNPLAGQAAHALLQAEIQRSIQRP